MFTKCGYLKDFLFNSVDTGRKLNVHKTFRRHPGRKLNVLCTFNLHSMPTEESTLMQI